MTFLISYFAIDTCALCHIGSQRQISILRLRKETSGRREDSSDKTSEPGEPARLLVGLLLCCQPAGSGLRMATKLLLPRQDLSSCHLPPTHHGYNPRPRQPLHPPLPPSPSQRNPIFLNPNHHRQWVLPTSRRMGIRLVPPSRPRSNRLQVQGSENGENGAALWTGYRRRRDVSVGWETSV